MRTTFFTIHEIIRVFKLLLDIRNSNIYPIFSHLLEQWLAGRKRGEKNLLNLLRKKTFLDKIKLIFIIL